MTESLNFQSIILNLQQFWAEQGCLIWQPYYTQVGAGTMNPATYLRVLGPEPWNVGYVEPSIRPDDGRYGENPNRMQMHYQFQVILKPDPVYPQEIYLRSLEALGIDPRQHDIRFVEDNWESPALGAWGLGWEVWLDGQEITQFTYFQQAGGMVLDPVSVEITYGLERIAIALQKVSSFRDIQWSPSLTDGDVNLQAEQEHSKYYFDIGDVSRLRQMYDLFEAEAQACLENKLVLPAHDYVLKCSHTFNVLDTRGAVGVTERQALFGRMRDLSRRVAEAYVEQREELGFPWLGQSARPTNQNTLIDDLPKETGRQSSVVDQQFSEAPFLLEIGTEELPAGDLNSAIEQLQKRLPGWLKALRLGHGELRVMGTPRRLVVHIQGLAARQPDLEEVAKGPPADRAFDQHGKPTKAAMGFARGKGVALEDLEVQEISGGRYVVAKVHTQGRTAAEVLAEALPDWIAALRFDKSMRWNSSNVAFSRPIRWLLALYGDAGNCQVVPFEYAGLVSGDRTRGLRFHEPQVIQVDHPRAYFDVLSAQGILLERDARQNVVLEQVVKLAAEIGGSIPEDPALLAEVTNLVEAPTALRGRFDDAYLELPREVLIAVMKKHQRYFPVMKDVGNLEPADQMVPDERTSAADSGNRLLPYFISVRNGDDQFLDTVTDGNEHVIRARFADAEFFVREDLKLRLEAYLPRLSTLTFQVSLGSMLDKVGRIEALVDDLAPWVGLNEDQLRVAHRAAQLSKADLATQMVVEMTSLQGQIGRYYALHSGETDAVARAIFEHYLPRHGGDLLPQERPGLLVGLADRLDSLVGLFAAGLAPTGNKDPFAQRRAARGIVQILIAWEMDFDLRAALDIAASHLPIKASEENRAAVLLFITERLRNLLLDGSRRYDVVDAVVAVQGHNPARAAQAAVDLENWVSRPDWSEILPAYSRCVRITRDLEQRYPVEETIFAESSEEGLYAALEKAEASERGDGDVHGFFNAFTPMIPAINSFFDEVLVMDDDERQRYNRLGLLQRIARLADGVADLSRLEGF